MVVNDYEEKRDFRRMDVDCPMTFTVDGDTTRYVGNARDLSATGLLIETSREVPQGALLEVDISPEKAIVPPLRAQVEVVRVTSLGPGSFELGVAIREMRG